MSAGIIALQGGEDVNSTEHTLEAGNGDQVLQIIRLDDGGYRAARLPQTNKSSVQPTTTVLPEMGEVLKWLETAGEL